MRRKIYLLLLVVLCGAMINPAIAKKKSKKKASTEATTKKKEKKETKYDKLFKDKKVTTAKGFITLHQFGNKVYFELPLKVLNRDILLGSTIAETTDNQFGCVGEKSGDPFLYNVIRRLHCVVCKPDSSRMIGRLKSACRVVRCRLLQRLSK